MPKQMRCTWHSNAVTSLDLSLKEMIDCRRKKWCYYDKSGRISTLNVFALSSSNRETDRANVMVDVVHAENRDRSSDETAAT